MTAGTLNLGPYRYRPGKQLDETRMSILWLAGEVSREGTVSPGDQVIVKIARMSETQYSLTNQRAIENEEKWLVNLSHPNIIRLRAVAERHASRQTVYRARSELPGNPWFLVTDYLSGGDLQSLLNERRKLPVSLALEIAEQLGDALTYLHARNCVHCDIKPRNILFHEQPTGYGLTEATRPIVIDFGIAKNPSDGPQAPSGTPRWITPELYEAMRVGRRLEVDPTWDIYAAGLVLYTMITGRKPELDNPGSHSWLPITAEDLAGDASVKQPKTLVEGLNRLIASTTADLSQERSSATAFTANVRKLRQHARQTGAAPVTPARGATGPRQGGARSSKGLWLALAGGALALVLAAVLLAVGIPGIGSGGASVDVTPPANSIPTPASGSEIAVVPDLPAETAATATPLLTPTSAATRRPTSTPLNTSTHTATPRPTATATPRPPTPTLTRTPWPTATATQNIASEIAVLVPALSPTATPFSTSTPLPVTSTRVPTPTPRPAPPSATPASGTVPPAPRPTTAASPMRVTLVEPDNNVAGEGMVAFTWRPSRELASNECFEVVFWQGDENNGWAQGWGIKGASRETRVERRFDSATQNTTDAWLKYGQNYYWAVLLIENCDAYRSGDRQNSSRQRVSDVRRFVVGN